ncbi:MAG: helix-turn-helix transcriptional regulator [Patescibacteria group bacterium]
METAPKSINDLSPREWQVMKLAAEGKTYKGIGTELGISDRTARFHMEGAKAKFGVPTRMQAIARFSKDSRAGAPKE